MRKFCGSAQDRNQRMTCYLLSLLFQLLLKVLYNFYDISVTVYLLRLHEREISHCGIPGTVDPRCLACLGSPFGLFCGSCCKSTPRDLWRYTSKNA